MARKPPGASALLILVLPAVLALVITGLLYGRSLGLPYYSDDLVQLPWLRGLRLGELWLAASPYGYYRPLTFSIWLLIGLPANPVILRVVNLLLHVLSALLCGMLVGRFSAEDRRPVATIAVTALFAAYPFAYQAIPWVSGMFYPLVTALCLGAVLAYLKAREMAAWRWLALSLLLAGMAPFAHENGVLASAFVVLAEAAHWLDTRAERLRLSWWPLLHLAMSAAFLLLWFSLRGGGVSTLNLSLTGLLENLTILLTGLIFPLAPLVQAGLPTAPGVWLLVAVILIAFTVLLWKRPAVLVIGLGWFAAGIVPVLVTMRVEWLIDAPRFLYLSGAGAALLWGALLAEAIALLPRARWRAGIAAATLALVLAPGAIFIWQGIEWHRLAAAPLRQAVALAGRHSESALFVNLPGRVGPAGPGLYPYFDSGAFPLPAQVNEHDLTGETRPDDRAVSAGYLLAQPGYRLDLYGPPIDVASLAEQVPGRRVFVTDYSGPQPVLRYSGSAHEAASACAHPLARFGDTLVLCEADMTTAGKARLLWELRPGSANPDALAVFVHVLTPDGSLVGQADGDPLSGVYPIQHWLRPAGKPVQVEDVRVLPVLPAGEYTVFAGIWTPATGERLPALDATGQPFADKRVPIGTLIVP
ncbi:MAG: hypothetical protein IT326_04795 [Anaerolineae bacterium]|nr:hypothetical protein [Anaerolineae bacterium]